MYQHATIDKDPQNAKTTVLVGLLTEIKMVIYVTSQFLRSGREETDLLVEFRNRVRRLIANSYIYIVYA
jgi:hypothetical protein